MAAMGRILAEGVSIVGLYRLVFFLLTLGKNKTNMSSCIFL